MDAQAPPVVINEIPWTDEITSRLQCEASRRCLPWLEREVRAGIAQLWECTAGRARLYVITRLDDNPREWVWCLAVGTGLAHFAPRFLAAAERKGWPIRFHTTSPAVARIARRHGFTAPPELVLRKG